MPGQAPPAALTVPSARLESPAGPSDSTDDRRTTSLPEALAPPTAVRVWPSKEIFGSSREVCIAHRGALYRLRITTQNRLNLQK